MHLIWKTMFSEKKIFKSYLSSTSIWVSIAEGTIRHSITSSLLLSVKILSILYLFTLREHNSLRLFRNELVFRTFCKKSLLGPKQDFSRLSRDGTSADQFYHFIAQFPKRNSFYINYVDDVGRSGALVQGYSDSLRISVRYSHISYISTVKG